MNRNTRTMRKLSSLMLIAILALGAPLIAYASKDANSENDLWTEVQRGNSVDDYQVYLAEYPKGKYAALAKSRIKRLQTDQTVREEEVDWERALDTATKAAIQDYLVKYPHGRYVKQARVKVEEYQRVPARPQLPFTVSEDIWRTIEASEAYRNSLRPRSYKISYRSRHRFDEYTGSKNSHLSLPAPTSTSTDKEGTALGDKCSKQRTSTFLSGKTYISDHYVCGGFLSLGSTSDGKTVGFIKSLDELKGSLFPLRVGNQMSLRYQAAYVPDPRFDSTHTSSCQVMNQIPASELHPRLTGTAWKIHCQGSYTSNFNNKTISSETDDYYLEDLRLMLQFIGQLNLKEKKFILPIPGDQTVTVTEGDYGSRSSTTYDSYDWTVDNEDQEKSKSKPPVQPTSAAGASANWGLADQDMSIMVGTDIMSKVRMSERRADILAAAQAGDMVSQYLIGASYEYGIGVEINDVQKVAWHTKSAEQGLARAIAALAMDRIRGSGTPEDLISGWSLLLEAANAGNAIAQYNAAILTLVGLDAGGGMTRQFQFLQRPDALVLLNRSAEAGVSAAQYSLGHSYLVGTEEHGKDLKLARYWLEKAAAQHLPQAIEDLETMRRDN